MGNICCGGKDESHKKGTLLSSSDSSDIDYNNASLQYQNDPSNTDPYNNIYNSNNNDPQQQQLQQQHHLLQQQQQQQQQQLISNQSSSVVLANQQQQQLIDTERYMIMREEQLRLEQIVQATGRVMVSIRSTRGSTGYYDQGFAAALWQHLEQTKAFVVTPEMIQQQSNKRRSSINNISNNSGNSTTDNQVLSLVSMPLPKPVTIPHEKLITTNVVDGSNEDDELESSSSLLHASVSTIEINNTTAADMIRQANSSIAVLARLSEPMWDHIDIHPQQQQQLQQQQRGTSLKTTSTTENVTRVSGEEGGTVVVNAITKTNDPLMLVDAIAESYLDSILPSRERIFAGSGPIIENLF